MNAHLLLIEDLSLFSSMEKNDPTLNSAELEKKLSENEREAERKTQQVRRTINYKMKNNGCIFRRFSKNFHRLIRIHNRKSMSNHPKNQQIKAMTMMKIEQIHLTLIHQILPMCLMRYRLIIVPRKF